MNYSTKTETIQKGKSIKHICRVCGVTITSVAIGPYPSGKAIQQVNHHFQVEHPDLQNDCALWLGFSGMTHAEAASLVGCAVDTMASYVTGRRNPPAEVTEKIKAVAKAVAKATSDAYALIHPVLRGKNPPDCIELAVPAIGDDDSPVPFASCYSRVAAGLFAFTGIPVELVPRGSTPGAAAALEIRKRAELGL